METTKNITSIQWADATVNFWHGCKKVSPGCKFCYMYRDKEHYGQDGTVVIKSKPATVSGKLKKLSPGDKIFTCSWSDFFIAEADAWRAEAWETIRANPDYIWMILTKRPERIAECLPPDWGDGWSNVWLGVSVESPAELWRVSMLMKTVAHTRFISYEPALDAVDFAQTPHPGYTFGKQTAPNYPLGNCFTVKDAAGEYMEGENGIYAPIDWLIIGGESGNDTGQWGYRPAWMQWYIDAARQAKEGGAAVFVKQMGTHLAKQMGLKDRHGGDPAEWPEVLQVREFPISPIYGPTE